MLDVYLKALKYKKNLNLCCSRMSLLVVFIPITICQLLVIFLNVYPIYHNIQEQNCTDLYTLFLQINWYLFQGVVIEEGLIMQLIVTVLARLQQSPQEEPDQLQEAAQTVPVVTGGPTINDE